MDFFFAKSRKPPASAIASSTVGELAITYDPGRDHLSQNVEFLAVDLLHHHRNFRLRNVILQLAGNVFFQPQGSESCGLDFPGQGKGDLPIRADRN